MNSKQQLL